MKVTAKFNVTNIIRSLSVRDMNGHLHFRQTDNMREIKSFCLTDFNLNSLTHVVTSARETAGVFRGSCLSLKQDYTKCTKIKKKTKTKIK